MNPYIHREYIKSYYDDIISSCCSQEDCECSETHYSVNDFSISNEICTSYVSPAYSEYFDLSKDETIHYEMRIYKNLNLN